jgi:invasion protein IalB
MAAFPKILTLMLALAAAAPVMAQTTTAPQPADSAQTGTTPTETTPAPAADPAATEPAPDGIGRAYVAEKFGDWDLRCIRTEDGADPCQLYQLLKEKSSGNPVSEITIVSLPTGGEVVAGATIITPLETLLIEQLSFSVDGGKPVTYPFSFCTQVGCIARLGFTEEEVTRLRAGKIATVTVVPVANPNAKVAVDVSLSGFTKALEAQIKTEEANATKAAPAAAPAEAAPADAAPAEAAPQQ